MRSPVVLACLVVLSCMLASSVSGQSSTGGPAPAPLVTICDRYTSALGFQPSSWTTEYALVDSIVRRAVFGALNYSSTLGVGGGTVALLDSTGPTPFLLLRSTSNFGEVNAAVSERVLGLTIPGSPAGVVIKQMVRRPSNGLWYFLASNGQLYAGDVDATIAIPTAGSVPLSTVGVLYPQRGRGTPAMDINPAGDALRIVSGDRNYRVSLASAAAGDPAGGATIDGTAEGGLLTIDQSAPDDVNKATPSINGAVATAYTNQYAGATSTQQYLLDSVKGLLRATSSNNGTFRTVGQLTGIVGTPLWSSASMRFVTSASQATNTLLLSLNVTTNGVAAVQLYSVDVATAAVTSIRSAGTSAYTCLTFTPALLGSSGIHQPRNAVAGIVVAGAPTLPYFNGVVKYKGASTPIYTAGGAPLTALLDSLVKFFGSSGALGCTATGFPAYSGLSMRAAHRNMNISQAEFSYFNGQVAASATSFGVSAADRDAVGGVLNSFGRGASEAICTEPDCQCAPGTQGPNCVATTSSTGASSPATQSSTGAAGGGGGLTGGSTTAGTGAPAPGPSTTLCDKYTTALGFDSSSSAQEQALVDSIVKRAVFGVVDYSTTLGVTTGTMVMLDNADPNAPKLIMRSTRNFGMVNTLVSEKVININGLRPATTLRDMTRRPVLGLYYFLGSDGQLYSGQADFSTVVALTPLGVPVAARAASPLGGLAVNPFADALRIVNANKNFRINITDGRAAGGAATDGTDAGNALTFQAGDVNAAASISACATAYTNQVVGAASTVQYVLDSALGLLQAVDSNAGVYRTLGALTGITGTIDYNTATMSVVMASDASKNTILLGLKVTNNAVAAFNIYSVALTGVATQVFTASSPDIIAIAFTPNSLGSNGIHNPANAVTGIVAAGAPTLPYFNGVVKYKGDATPIYTNGGAPLAALLTSLVRFFGSSGALSCTATGFPAYSGLSMRAAHRNMNITQSVFSYFNGQVAASATSFGVSAADRDAVGGVLASFGRGSPEVICTEADCACSPTAPAGTCVPPPFVPTSSSTGAAAGTTGGTVTPGDPTTTANFALTFALPNSYWTNSTVPALRQEIATALGIADVSRVVIDQAQFVGANPATNPSTVNGYFTAGTPAASDLNARLIEQANNPGSDFRKGVIGQSATGGANTTPAALNAAPSNQVAWFGAILAVCVAIMAQQL